MKVLSRFQRHTVTVRSRACRWWWSVMVVGDGSRIAKLLTGDSENSRAVSIGVPRSGCSPCTGCMRSIQRKYEAILGGKQLTVFTIAWEDPDFTAGNRGARSLQISRFVRRRGLTSLSCWLRLLYLLPPPCLTNPIFLAPSGTCLSPLHLHCDLRAMVFWLPPSAT